MDAWLQMWVDRRQREAYIQLYNLRVQLGATDDHNTRIDLDKEMIKIEDYLQELDEKPLCMYSGHSIKKAISEGYVWTYCQRCNQVFGQEVAGHILIPDDHQS